MDYTYLNETSIFLEVGAFDNYGGWVLDTQFIPNMGSAYLLAHGIGEKVADAHTTVIFPKQGKYRVWVRTKNWVGEWKKDYAPGIFKVRVNEWISETAGNTEKDWCWQAVGEFEVKETSARVSLMDLTGFEGRCAALFFTSDMEFIPPVQLDSLDIFRRTLCGNLTPKSGGEFDIVIAGGGIAGITSALSSARRGLKTAFVQDREVLGGNNSSEVRVWLGGETNFAPYPNIGNIVKELEPEKHAHYGSDNIASLYEDDKRLDMIKSEPNITLFTGYFLLSTKVENDLISEVTVLNVKDGSHTVLKAKYFVDCTGDATLGFEAGADFEVTTNGHMGMTNFWYVEDTGENTEFPECPWAIDIKDVSFPGRKGVKNVYGREGVTTLGCWYWESGCEHDPIAKSEYARDTNFRAMYGAWDVIKNTDHDLPTYKIGHSSYIGGKRESRRLLGDILLTKSEVSKDHVFDDACVPSTWNFDVHYPDRRFYGAFSEGDGFLTKDYHESFKKPYFVPYRCLYSRNVKNLFMAGRNVSVTHDALGTVRVMRTGGMMGEVIGIAAYLCKQNACLPRDIYTKYLNEFKQILSE